MDGTPTGGGIQVSDPSDRFEREAAANAERAMSAPAPVAASPAEQAVQRQADEEEEPEDAGGPEEEEAAQLGGWDSVGAGGADEFDDEAGSGGPG